MAKSVKQPKEKKGSKIKSTKSIDTNEVDIDDEHIFDYTIVEIIDKFKNTINQEIGIISAECNNWVDKRTPFDIESFYEIESMLLSMHMGFVKEIYDVLNGRTRLEAKLAFKYLDKLRESYIIHNNRVMVFLRNENTASLEITNNNLDEIKQRIEFRSLVSKNHAKFKKIISMIPFDDDSISASPIILHAKTPVLPLSVRSVVEAKYPMIKDYINKKNNTIK